MNLVFLVENQGEYICEFLDKLRRPVATTFHTVLPCFENQTKDVFNRVIERSTRLIVLNETTRSLVEQYGVSSKKIKVIPHGCPDLPMVSSAKVKPVLGLKNKIVLSTFGLLRRVKASSMLFKLFQKLLEENPE